MSCMQIETDENPLAMLKRGGSCAAATATNLPREVLL